MREQDKIKRRLPKGEETLPITELRGQLLTADEVKQLYPQLYQMMLIKPKLRISHRLLIERMRRRIAQGRVPTLYRLECELTPEEQLRHMELEDDIGRELIEAERKLLLEEIRIIREA